MRRPSLDELRSVDLFDGLSEAELREWIAVTEVEEVPAGTVIADQGQSPEHVRLVLTGAIEAIAIDADGHAEPIGEHRAPTWVGAIAVITGGLSGVRMVAIEPVTLGSIAREPFVALVLAQRPVFERVMRQVRPVVSRIAAREQ
jgi:CRP-like cAMP-binding protein